MKKDLFTISVCLLLICLGIIIDDIPIATGYLFSAFPELFAWLDTFIRPIFFFVASILAIILAVKKLSINVKALFSIKGHTVYGPHIYEVTLINKKDSNLIIYSIDLELPSKQIVELRNFSPPTLLKALDTRQFDIEPFTDKGPTYEALKKSKIKLSTENKYYTCKPARPKRTADVILPFRSRVHGVVVGEMARNVIVLKESKTSDYKVIQVSKSGGFTESIRGVWFLEKDLSDEDLFNFLNMLNLYDFRLYDATGLAEIIYPKKVNKEAAK